MIVVKAILLLIIMIYCHLIDDYVLQGILAKLKQRNYWVGATGPKYEKYKYDYIVALICHALEWSITISIPILVLFYCNPKIILGIIIIVAIIVNTIIHSIVDHLKANEFMINLVIDQSIHLLQIVVYWLAIIFLGGTL